jgi:hypothetical protein
MAQTLGLTSDLTREEAFSRVIFTLIDPLGRSEEHSPTPKLDGASSVDDDVDFDRFGLTI